MERCPKPCFFLSKERSKEDFAKLRFADAGMGQGRRFKEEGRRRGMRGFWKKLTAVTLTAALLAVTIQPAQPVQAAA